MSAEVVNLFTSSNNISYLKDELSKHIKNVVSKEAVLETLTEAVFNFHSYGLIEDSGQRLRHSANTKDEISRLNKAFIDDRLSFANNFDMYAEGREFYADQMFIDDSLRPGPYDYFNDDEDDKRIFRYQDPLNSNRSKIPIQQINNRGHTDYNNVDELRGSEVSQIRRVQGASVKVDHIGTISVDCKRPQWIDM